MAKSSRITIETNSLLIFHSRTSSSSWCRRCAADVEMIALDCTAVLSNLPPHEVDEWLNSIDLHRSQTPDGTELICLNSLLSRLGSGSTK